MAVFGEVRSREHPEVPWALCYSRSWGAILPDVDTLSAPIAVLGAGKMGEIMAAGIVRSGLRTAGQVLVSDASPERLEQVVAHHGFTASPGNRQAVAGAGIVLLAVKPKDLSGLLADIAPALRPEQLIISIVAGVTTSTLEASLAGVPVVRAMPNVGSQVGEGMTAICPGSRAGDEHLGAARRLLEATGPVVTVDEGLLDAVTALSGSGPAYFALVAEAMVDAGVTVGLPRPLAQQLVAQTLRGTAGLVTDGKMQPAEVRHAVSSPGGTTAVALGELERAGVRAAVLNAVQAALQRSRALAGGEASPRI